MKVSRSPTMAEVLKVAMETRLTDLHVAMPGRIESYDVNDQKATVLPLLKRTVIDEDGNETVESLPTIPNVPVVFPRAGDFFLSFPVKRGDHVLLVFCERSIDGFLDSNGQPVDPVDLRKHSLSDAVAYPGLYPITKSIKDSSASDMVLGKDEGMRLHLRAGQAEFLDGGTQQSVAIAEKLEQLYTLITTGIKFIFDNHIHPTGVGPSGLPQIAGSPASFPAWDNDINSDKLKVSGN